MFYCVSVVCSTYHGNKRNRVVESPLGLRDSGYYRHIRSLLEPCTRSCGKSPFLISSLASFASAGGRLNKCRSIPSRAARLHTSNDGDLRSQCRKQSTIELGRLGNSQLKVECLNISTFHDERISRDQPKSELFGCGWGRG